jgi:hypothetical protein
VRRTCSSGSGSGFSIAPGFWHAQGDASLTGPAKTRACICASDSAREAQAAQRLQQMQRCAAPGASGAAGSQVTADVSSPSCRPDGSSWKMSCTLRCKSLRFAL